MNCYLLMVVIHFMLVYGLSFPYFFLAWPSLVVIARRISPIYQDSQWLDTLLMNDLFNGCYSFCVGLWFILSLFFVAWSNCYSFPFLFLNFITPINVLINYCVPNLNVHYEKHIALWLHEIKISKVSTINIFLLIDWNFSNIFIAILLLLETWDIWDCFSWSPFSNHTNTLYQMLSCINNIYLIVGFLYLRNP